MTNDPYAEIDIRSNKPDLTAGTIAACFTLARVPVWIKPQLDGQTIKVAYPLIQQEIAEELLKTIQKNHDKKLIDCNGSLLR